MIPLKSDSGNSWYYSLDHGQLCQVIEAQALWGETTCRVWLPGRDLVAHIPASRLKSLENAGTVSSNDIVYISAAARVADSLTPDRHQDGTGVLLAPIESSVIPLPHQIRALSQAIANPKVRYLLADEVGLGKTIEAGLIMRELKLRGMVKRTLVIAPKGLVNQWVAEMQTHFQEQVDLLHRFLADRGFQSVTLNGSMSLEERKKAQDQFAGDSRILISTDAGGEGLNLQFCHVVINYDLPWNPMRLEQRIGRVDRIGQTHRVKAVNFVLEDSVFISTEGKTFQPTARHVWDQLLSTGAGHE